MKLIRTTLGEWLISLGFSLAGPYWRPETARQMGLFVASLAEDIAQDAKAQTRQRPTQR